MKSRQMMKTKLALEGGLQSSDPKKSSDDQRAIRRLQELSKIIESTVLTEVLTTIPQDQNNDG